MILDENKNVTEMNQAAVELIGNKRKLDSFCDICNDSHGSLKICEYDQCFLKQQLSYYELQLNHESGKKSRFLLVPHYTDANQKTLTIISIRNLSDYRKGE